MKKPRFYRGDRATGETAVIAEPLEQRLLLSIFTVTNANDSGPGSLRQAILDHQASAPDDVLTFDPVVFSTPQTISLLTALPTLNFPIVKGPGSSLLTVRRDPAAATNFRIFDSGTLAMSGITITGGRTDFNGGGMWATGPTTLDDVVFFDNKTVKDGYDGGAIASLDFLTIRNSMISG